MSDDGDGEVSFDVDVEDDRSVIRVVGTRDAAVVVAGPVDETIYLPPENFAADLADDDGVASSQTSYDGETTESPYDGIDTDGPDGVAPSDSPYESADGGTAVAGDAEGVRSGGEGAADDRRESVGVKPTVDGFEIVHPSSIHDVRILR